MSLDFPNFPNVGDVWTGTNGANYVWDSQKWILQPGNSTTFLPLPANAANDAAAAAAGVQVGGVYRNGSVLMVRVA